ncbi:MAG TPA: TIM barrel protein [Candidatus Brocadiia bacterium]|nr:TIM barrel protein [Candidatus Brocadiia bacterium]
MAGKFRFSFGPWNIHEGSDPFGPTVRGGMTFARKLALYKELGYDGVQFHDDDAVPDLNDLAAPQVAKKASALGQKLKSAGLTPEFVAPRLWEDPRTIDGGYTSNSKACRVYAIERSLLAIDIARELGTRNIVLWLAREGTYMREAKDPVAATNHLIEAVNAMLAHDPQIRILIEPKPNEPMDVAYIPTIGHALALGHLTSDPARVGCLVESAHAILAGLDPSDEMAFALAQKKLWSVHLNDQNGLKFDEDRAFGTVNLRRAFSTVMVLDANDYGQNGEYVGMDVKAIRTQKKPDALRHLVNSRAIFLALLDVARSLDAKLIAIARATRDYEALDALIIGALMKRRMPK